MADEQVHQYGKGVRKNDGRLVIGIVVIALLGAFILQNRDEVNLTILVFDFSLPLWIALGGTLLISLGVGFMLGRGRYKS